jgi:hypothetical protein
MINISLRYLIETKKIVAKKENNQWVYSLFDFNKLQIAEEAKGKRQKAKGKYIANI